MYAMKLTDYVFYDKQTGVVCVSGNIQKEHIQCPEGMGVLFDTIGEVGKDYVEDGKVVQLLNPPTPFYKFDYKNKCWILNTPALEYSIKQQRSQLLNESDWTQLPDVDPMTRTNWLYYRQALRDITDQEGYPTNVVWPIKPTN